jgi:hypothetical protein
MKIKIKVDELEPTLDSLIKEELARMGLPTCFGNMVPPILKRIIDVDIESVFEERELTPQEQIKQNDVLSFVAGDSFVAREKVLTQKGIDFINAYKKERMNTYVQQLAKCASCEFQNVCYRLTDNYLKVISRLDDSDKKKRG